MIEYKGKIGYIEGDEVDDGTMLENVAELEEAVVGHRIIEVEHEHGGRWGVAKGLILTLDDGTRVTLRGGSDCCAYTELEGVIEHLPTVDHIITKVTAQEDDFERWHILADMEEVLELRVGWSAGNPFYYAYGFDIQVSKPGELRGAEGE